MMKFFMMLLLLIFPFPILAETNHSEPVSSPSFPKGLYAFETSSGMRVGAVFGVLPPLIDADDLVSVTSPVSSRIEIHEMKDVDGIMKMRKVDFIPLKRQEENILLPTGYHLMLMNLKSPLQEGTEFPMTLVFRKASSVTVTVPVLGRGVN